MAEILFLRILLHIGYAPGAACIHLLDAAVQVTVLASRMPRVSADNAEFHILWFRELQTPVATSSVGSHLIRVLRVALWFVLVLFLLVRETCTGFVPLLALLVAVLMA
jgi:hypothetical protein